MADERKSCPPYDRRLLAGFVGYVVLNIIAFLVETGSGSGFRVYLAFFALGAPAGIGLLVTMIQVGERQRPFTWYAFTAFVAGMAIIACVNVWITLGAILSMG